MFRLPPIAMTWLDAFDARWSDARRRAGPIALTALIEIVLLLALLSLGARSGHDGAIGEALTTFDVSRDEAPEPERPHDEPAPEAPAQPAPSAVTPPSALPSPPAIILPRAATMPPVAPPSPEAVPSPAPSTAKIRAVIRSDMAANRGPADTGSPGDSQRIAGSGPNGEPLYAARWYREPTDDDFRGYFSRVGGSAWALINCRTEPEFRVDHCVLVDEWPARSGAGSAVLAMAWQFRVRPPRIGGRSMVGEWVRIRIEYNVKGP